MYTQKAADCTKKIKDANAQFIERAKIAPAHGLKTTVNKCIVCSTQMKMPIDLAINRRTHFQTDIILWPSVRKSKQNKHIKIIAQQWMKANNNVQCVRVCASAKNAQVLFFHITEQWSKGMLNYAVGSLLFVFCFLLFFHLSFANTFGIRFSFTYHIIVIAIALAFCEPHRLIKNRTNEWKRFAFKSEQAIF